MDRTQAHVADMLAFGQELTDLLAGKTLAQFLDDRVLCLATEKLFINLGEAAKRVNPAHAGQVEGVAWSRLIGLRNILAHGYEQIEHEVLFKTVEQDLPALNRALAHWLASQPPG